MATEIYHNIYRHALTTARAQRHSIKGVIGEAVAEVERLYYEDAVGNVHEVPYICPPLDFCTETGDGIGRAIPEHVMLRLVDGADVVSNNDIIFTLSMSERDRKRQCLAANRRHLFEI